jgi:hypothetical protein
LDAALVDYHTENLELYTKGTDFLTGRDPYGEGYIALHREDLKRQHALNEQLVFNKEGL